MEFVHKPKNHSNLKNPDVVLWFIVETWCNCKSMKMFIKKVSFFYFIFRETAPLLDKPLEVGDCAVYYILFILCSDFLYIHMYVRKCCWICVETMLWEREEGYDWSENPTFFLFFFSSHAWTYTPFILLSPYFANFSKTRLVYYTYMYIDRSYQHGMLLGYYLWVFGSCGKRISFFLFLFLVCLVCLVCGCKVKFYDGTCLVSVSGTNWKSAIHVMFVRTRERIFRSWSLCNKRTG